MATNELWRKGVADHKCNCLLTAGQIEDVIARKALKKRRFAHRYSAIFLWMKKATFGWVETATRYSGRHLVPCHPSVNVLKAVDPFMTIQLAALRKIAAASAILGNITDQSQNSLCSFLFRNVV